MTTLVTTINNEFCVATSMEDMSTAYDVHQAQVDSALIGVYGEADVASEYGTCYIRKNFVTYMNGKYAYEGYYTVQDVCYWDYGEHNYQWCIRLKGIDYEVEDDLEDEETEDWE